MPEARISFPRLLAVLLLLLPASAWAGAIPGRPDRTHIVFGYMQLTAPEGPLASYRWHALTHLGYTFVSFGSDGTIDRESRQRFRTRSPELKRDGAAANNGVRVIAVLNNRGFKTDIIDAVFPSGERRSRLVREVVALVTDPQTGCDGLSLDLEPMNFKPHVAAGYNLFLIELAGALHSLKPRRELSMYVGSYYPGRYSLATFRDQLDFILFSAYNFAPGDVVGDVGLVQTTHKGIDSWLRAGLPPDRIVLTLALFGKQWEAPKAAWGVTGAGPKSIGMDYGNYLITTRQRPLAANPGGASRSCVWTAEPFGNPPQFRIATFDDLTAHRRKLRMALAWDGESAKGASLGGVGFWSLMWIAQGLQPGSADPNDPAARPNAAWRRTYTPPWTLWEESFAPPTQKLYRAETFEGIKLDPRWVAPPDGPDAVNATTSCGVVAAPAPPGAPAGSQRVAALNFAFSRAPGRLLCKYRPLTDANPPHAIDRNSLLVLTDAATEFRVPIFVPGPVTGATVRLVVLDSQSELERSPPFALATPGWRTLRWDLADPASVAPYTTREGGCRSGDGKINSTGHGTRDIAFIGFEIESSAPGSASGTIDIDQILYGRSLPTAAAK